MDDRGGMSLEDYDRELQKALDTLNQVDKYLSAMNESNAALHCSSTIIHSPLTMKVKGTIINLEAVRLRLDVGPDQYG